MVKKVVRFRYTKVMLAFLVLLWSIVVFLDVANLVTKDISVVSVLAYIFSSATLVSYILELKSYEHWVKGRKLVFDSLLLLLVFSRFLIIISFGL